MQTIGIISRRNPFAKDSWSGTIASISEVLSNEYRLVWIPAKQSWLSLLAGKGLTAVFRFAGMNFSRYHTKMCARSSARYIRRFTESSEGIDVLLAPAGAVYIAFLKTSIPIIYLSDATFELMVDYYSEFSKLPEFNKQAGNLIELLALKSAAHVVFSSNWAKSSAQNHYAVDPAKLSVIRFGPNTDYVKISEASTRQPINSRDSLNLLFLGVDWKRKGGELALEAHRRLRDAYGVNSVLRIVGCSPDIEPDPSVEVVGFLKKSDPIEHDRFRRILESSHVMLLPTQAECAGIAFVEAIAAGIPVVTCDTGGVSDYVLHGRTGLCLPLDSGPTEFAEAILSITSTDSEYERFCSECEKYHSDTLNWGFWLSKFNSVVASVRACTALAELNYPPPEAASTSSTNGSQHNTIRPR